MKGSSTSFLSYGLIISLILAYFEYNSLEGVLAIGVLYFIMSFVNILSIIPFIGWIGSMLINWCIVIPMVLSFTGIEMTWLIGLIFIYKCFWGFIVTALVTIVIIGTILNS